MSGKLKREKSTRLPDSVGHVAIDCVGLPGLSSDISLNVIQDEVSLVILNAAKVMLAARIINDEITNAPIGELVFDGLNKWMTSIFSQHKYFDYSARICGSIASSDFLGEHHPIDDDAKELRSIIQTECGLDPINEHLSIIISASHRTDVVVGAGVMALESESPGLGFEVLRAIERVGSSYGLFGGSWLTYCTEMTQWGGGSSEVEWAENYCEELSDFQGIRKADLDLMVPHEWLHGTELTDEQLEKIEQNGSKKIQRICKLLKLLRSKKDSINGFSLVETSSYLELGECTEPTVFLIWENNSSIYQIADDYTNYCWESGESEPPGLSIALMPTNDASWFNRQEKKWLDDDAMIGIIDELLGFIGKEL